jgi:tripartite-type tricarboxylate transporter receptor subunit TctC
MEYLKQAAIIDLVHVPYKGTGPMITDLLGGQTQATFTGRDAAHAAHQARQAAPARGW